MARKDPWLSQDDIDVILDLKKAHIVLGELAEALPDGYVGKLGSMVSGYRDLLHLLEQITDRMVSLAADIENDQRGQVSKMRLSNTSHLTVVKGRANVPA